MLEMGREGREGEREEEGEEEERERERESCPLVEGGDAAKAVLMLKCVNEIRRASCVHL